MWNNEQEREKLVSTKSACFKLGSKTVQWNKSIWVKVVENRNMIKTNTFDSNTSLNRMCLWWHLNTKFLVKIKCYLGFLLCKMMRLRRSEDEVHYLKALIKWFMTQSLKNSEHLLLQLSEIETFSFSSLPLDALENWVNIICLMSHLNTYIYG